MDAWDSTENEAELELECRVCRCGPDELHNRPLYQPCLCNGSIALVHQDCLETWLEHSKKDTCELCSTKYTFIPQYAENTPASVPFHLMLKATFKLWSFKFLPFALRCILAIILWLFAVPVWTIWLYKVYMRNQSYKEVIATGFKWGPGIRGDAISGLVLIGVILLSFLILMSFADFVRLFWLGDGAPRGDIPDVAVDARRPQVPMRPIANRDQWRRGPRAPVLGPAPAIAPIPMPIARPANVPPPRVRRPIIANIAPIPPFRGGRERTLNLGNINNTETPQSNSLNIPNFTFPKDPTANTRIDIHNGEFLISELPERAELSTDGVSTKKIHDLPNLQEKRNSPAKIFRDKYLSEEVKPFTRESPMLSNSFDMAKFEITDSSYPYSTHTENKTSDSLADQRPSELITELEELDEASNPLETIAESLAYASDAIETSENALDKEETKEEEEDENECDSPINSFGLRRRRALSSPSEITTNITDHSSAHVGSSKRKLRDPVPTGDISSAAISLLIELPKPAQDKPPLPYVHPISNPRDTGILGDTSHNTAAFDFNLLDDNEDLPNLSNDSSSSSSSSAAADSADGDIECIDEGIEDDSVSSGASTISENLNNDAPLEENEEDDLDDLDDGIDEFIGEFDDVPPADVEVRFALDELLGFRGPFINLFKHVLWFLAFLGVYMCFVIFMPMFLGDIVFNLVSITCPQAVTFPVQYAMPVSLRDFISNILELSIRNKSSIQLSDFGLVITGYVTMFTMISTLQQLIRAAKDRFFMSLNYFVKILDNFVIAGKIGALLSIRIFLLPIGLGYIIIYAFNRTIHHYSMDTWTNFASVNLIGCLTLSWTLGITYMLLITLSVLQLREILHPNIFAKCIRPQETHQELLQSLVQESGLVHVRRLAVSMLVYLLLMTLLIYAPLCTIQGIAYILHSTGLISGTNPLVNSIWHVKTWYKIHELQIPLEVAIGHFAMLTILEKKKNYIGRFFYLWMTFLADRLNMTRYILPCPMKRCNGTFARDSEGNPKVGRPLRRPPRGWDARNNRAGNNRHQPIHSTRWAWGDETPSEIELSVAPQLQPKKYCRLKIAVFALATWIMLVALVMFIIFVPVFIGRFSLTRLSIPDWLHHDPVCFVLGGFACSGVAPCLTALYSLDFNHYKTIVKSIPLDVYRKVAELVLLWNISHILVKLLFTLPFHPEISLETLTSLPYLFELWACKRLIIDIVLCIGILGGLEFFMQKLGIPDAYGAGEWTQSVRHAAVESLANFAIERYDLQSLRINELGSSLIYPVFNRLTRGFLGMGLLFGVWGCEFLTRFIVFNIGLDIPDEIFSSVLFKFNRYWSCLVIGYWLFKLVSTPTITAGKKFYGLIRDENYLIGRKLQNAKPTPAVVVASLK